MEFQDFKVFGACRKFIDQYFLHIIVAIIIIKIALLFYLVSIDWLAWDKGLWYKALAQMKDTGLIPYISTNEWTLAVSEYPISFTYFLLLFYPIIQYLQENVFFIIFGLCQMAADAGIVYLLYKMTKNRMKILFGFALAPTVLLLSTSRFDLMPSFLLLLSLYLLSKRRSIAGGITHTIAIFFKVYPIAFALSYAKKLIKNKAYVTSLVTTGLILNWFILINPDTLLHPLQGAGGFRPESLFGLLGLMGVIVPCAETINMIALVSIILIALFFAKARFGASLAIIMALIITSKILSLQWNLWLLPLFVLSSIPLTWIIVFELVTIIEFPFIWGSVAVETGFDVSNFLLTDPTNIIFLLLNFARYGVYLYFIYYCISHKNILSSKVQEDFQRFLN